MAGGRPLVVCCYLRGRLFPQVASALVEQWPQAAFHEDQPHPLCSYADFVRTIWAGLGDIVIVEGDSIPPPGSIRGLLDCPREWCSHPSWVGDRTLDSTLALVKFSQALQLRLPGFMEEALARPIFKANHYDRGLGWERPRRFLGVVAVDSSALATWPELEERSRSRGLEPGTTAHPKAIDMAIERLMRLRGVAVHPHQPPAPHLRYPESDPLLAGGGRLGLGVKPDHD